jgi:hypothetical protein
MKVVFPAPLGPINPTISPGATSIDMRSTASTPPNRSDRSRTRSAKFFSRQFF